MAGAGANAAAGIVAVVAMTAAVGCTGGETAGGASPTPSPASPSPTPTEPGHVVWDRIADCESGAWGRNGDPIRGSAEWDDGVTATQEDVHFEGGLHFDPDTWDEYRTTGMPAHAGDATRQEAIRVAERVHDDQGWDAWPVCSEKLGLG